MTFSGIISGVGILPMGTLGAAFFRHLTPENPSADVGVKFVGRRASAYGNALLKRGSFALAYDQRVETLTTNDFYRTDLFACADENWLPRILLVSTQPDQLLSVAGDYVALLERLTAANGLDDAVAQMPLFVLCSNGIYHERVRRFLVELLEESMLYGRLPDLWDGAMGHIVGKMIRGVSLQTGGRRGDGADAIYYPGPRGRTTLAGGDAKHRNECAELLTKLGGWFDADDAPPLRIEFDKALINLWSNLLGQLKAITDDGKFRLLGVSDIFSQTPAGEMRELSTHVFSVGRAVRAYRPEEDGDQLHESALAKAASAGNHVPSSLQWIAGELKAGTLRPKLTPTETWLLEPLIRYARTAGLQEAAEYFELLRQRIEHRLASLVS